MKQLFYIFGGCLLGIAIVLLFLKKTTTQTAQKPTPPILDSELQHSSKQLEAHGHSHSFSHTHRVMQYPNSENHNSRDNELVLRSEEPPDLSSLGIDASIFKDVTNDPALIRILATHKPPSVGEVRKQDNGRVFLELDRNRRFEASVIGNTRSKDKNGAVAFDAITSQNGETIKEIDAHHGGVSISGNPSEIWVVNTDGSPERISPEDIHGTDPIISPNGRFVAFTARYISRNALHAKFLMINDRVTKKFTSYAGRREESAYEIGAVDWVDNGLILRVVEDWGETGGHLVLKQVPAPN